MGDLLVTEKRCNHCHEFKPLDQFYKNKNHKYGRSSQCKECHRLIMRRDRKKESYDYRKNLHLLRAYGVSLKQWRAIVASQFNLCRRCGRDMGDQPIADHEGDVLLGAKCITCWAEKVLFKRRRD